ncbi:MAG: hypothetical protein RL701_4640, partial [Pseudomonadota bacterium]
MYGLINRGVEELITSRYGEAAWEAIKLRAGFGDVGFLTQQRYDDELTYRLVDASGDYLCIPRDDVLVSFGEFWVQFMRREGYSNLFDLIGRDLPEFLMNLNSLHTRIMVIL